MAIIEETEEETCHEGRETSLTLINESTVGPLIEAETTSNALELTKYCAQWILKISETEHLTRVATVGIVEDASSLIRKITLCLQTQVLNFLQMNQITIENDEAFSQIFSNENPTITPFSNLITFNQQLSYYRRHFNLIVSWNYQNHYFNRNLFVLFLMSQDLYHLEEKIEHKFVSCERKYYMCLC